MIGFGALTSLTGGGDLGDLTGGKAESGVGDTSWGSKQTGGVNFGARKPTNNVLIFGVVIAAIAIAYIFKK